MKMEIFGNGSGDVYYFSGELKHNIENYNAFNDSDYIHKGEVSILKNNQKSFLLIHFYDDKNIIGEKICGKIINWEYLYKFVNSKNNIIVQFSIPIEIVFHYEFF